MFPFVRYLKKYKIILPKILSYIVWSIFKPEQMNYNGKILQKKI